MSLQNPYLKYRQSQLETTPKLKLIVMLYDGAIRFLQQSIPAIQSSDFEQKGLMINKTISILSHLTGTLDYVRGGEVAVNVCRTNHYLTRRLVEANSQNDPAIVSEVIVHLRDLREAWNTVAAGIDDDKKPVGPAVPTKPTELSLAA